MNPSDVIVFGGGQAGLAAGHFLVAFLTDDAAILPVEYGYRVTGFSASGVGYRMESDGRALEARQVAVATGPFQVPRTPQLAAVLDGGVTELHSAEYRNPAQIPAGPVPWQHTRGSALLGWVEDDARHITDAVSGG